MDDARIYSVLKWVAILGAVAWLGYEGYNHFAVRDPGDTAYIAGNNEFKDGNYKRAEAAYRDAIKLNQKHTAALRGLANTLIQQKRYSEALQTIELSMVIEPDFAGHFFTRGVIRDHMGRYQGALEDYDKAIQMDEEIADGMHWLDRLLHNVQEKPPTVADRAEYLRQQLALPEDQRVLKDPEIDDSQRPYEQ